MNMSENIALGAATEMEAKIMYISEAHEKFYYEKLKAVRYQDVYHKALCYCLGISDDTRYRAKTRFAKFFNLPELISLFKESADIQTQDMLKLPIPEAEYENVVLKPSDYQKEMVQSLAERAEGVRNRVVEPYQDNMLKITND